MPDREGNGRPPGEQEPIEPAVEAESKYSTPELTGYLYNSYNLYQAVHILRHLEPTDRAKAVANRHIREAAESGIREALQRGRAESVGDLAALCKIDISTEEFQTVAIEGMARLLRDYRPQGGWNNRDTLSYLGKCLTDESVMSQAVQEALSSTVVELLNQEGNRNFSAVESLFELVTPSEAVWSLPQLQKEAEKNISSVLQAANVTRAVQLVDKFHVAPEKYNKIAFERTGDLLREGLLAGATDVWNSAHRKGVIQEDERLVEAAQVGVLNTIAVGDIASGQKMLDTFKLQKEFLATVEAQEAGRKGLAVLLSRGTIRAIDTIRQLVDLPDSVMQDPEVQQGAWSYVYEQLKKDAHGNNATTLRWVEVMRLQSRERTDEQTKSLYGALRQAIWTADWDVLKEMQKVFAVGDGEMTMVAQETVIKQLEQGDTRAITTKHHFHLPDTALQSPEATEAAKTGFVKALDRGAIDEAAVIEERCALSAETVRELVKAEILEIFSGKHQDHLIDIVQVYNNDLGDFFESKEAQQGAEQHLKYLLYNRDVDEALQVAEVLAVTPETRHALALGAVGWWLQGSHIAHALEIKNSFGLPRNTFTSPEMAEKAREGLQNALNNGNDEAAYVIEYECAIKDSVVREAATTSLVTMLQHGYLDSARRINDLFEPEQTKIASRDVPFRMLYLLPTEPGFKKLYEQDAWHDAVEKLLKLQARSAHAEHDPWTTDMAPLVNALVAAKVLDRDKPEDAEQLVEFVKVFGMYNLPRMAQLFIELKRGADFAKVTDGAQEQLRKIIGNRVEKMQGEQIINELRRFRREMQSELLADSVPNGIETAVGGEVFAGIKGETKWGRNDTPHKIVETWRTTMASNPDAAKLPEGYRERTIQVPLISRKEKVERPNALKERQEKTAKILARKSGENPTELGSHFTLLEDAAGALRGDRASWWAERRAALAEALSFDSTGMEKAVQTREAALVEKGTPPDKIAKILDGVRAGYNKKRVQAEEGARAVQALEFPTPEADDATMVAFMEQLAQLGKEQLVKSILLSTSLAHLAKSAPDWSSRLGATLAAPGGRISPEQVAAQHDVYTQFITEHYLSHEGEEHHTGHTSFSPQLLDALEWAYGIPKDIDAHILSRSRQALEALEQADTTVSGETMSISLVPAQGLLRIYAGDVGDACYTSQHASLAAGKAPDLHAVILVTNRSTPQERMNGSVLFVETRTPDGENVLLVRANNPRENLIGQVDAEALVKGIIAQAIATAEERGLDMVVVPLDKATQSSSNRSAVSEYYAKHYGKAKKIGLVQEDETMFNAYHNWNAEGSHPSVVVWRRNKK